MHCLRFARSNKVAASLFTKHMPAQGLTRPLLPVSCSLRCLLVLVNGMTAIVQSSGRRLCGYVELRCCSSGSPDVHVDYSMHMLWKPRLLQRQPSTASFPICASSANWPRMQAAVEGNKENTLGHFHRWASTGWLCQL